MPNNFQVRQFLYGEATIRVKRKILGVIQRLILLIGLIFKILVSDFIPLWVSTILFTKILLNDEKKTPSAFTQY